MEKHLHIITYTVPYPANYGALIDIFYKLIALHAEGIHIHLHCFSDSRDEHSELSKYCATIQYYERYMGHKGISNTLPYVVASRKNELLVQNLLKDNYPIFMEGVQSTSLLLDERFTNRRCFVRVHTVSSQYYFDLFKNVHSPLKKMYYWMESRLVKSYEKKIANRSNFWGTTEKDCSVYQKVIGCKNIELLPFFLPDWQVQCQEGMGSYCLYHADLSDDANDLAATWLLEKVFRKIKVPLVITGKNPSQKLLALAHEQSHTCLVPNPSEKEMQDMITRAHINLAPTLTTTGMRVKLINALFHGRHCVVNESAVMGTGLESACHIGSTPNAFQEIIVQLYHQPFTTDEIALRKHLLTGMFNNEINAKKQVKWIWG